MKNIEIFCENNNQYKEYPLGTTLLEIAKDMGIEMQFPICGALVNNKVRELVFDIVKPKNIRFIDYTSTDGKRIYNRTLFFILYVAVRDLMPNAKLKIDHGISKGFYCEIENIELPLCDDCIEKIKARMKEIIAQDLPIERKGKQMERVLSEYSEAGLNDKVQLYEGMGWLYAYVYYLDGHINYFHGHLLPSTGYVTNFDIERFNGGMFLRLPSEQEHGRLRDFIQQDKLFEIFQQHKDWASILNMANIGSLNQLVRQGKEGEIIKISEALHEKKIAEIATMISDKNSKIKLILIAGPSSSGKTTFSKRLAVQLAVCGIKSSQISLDNYFVDREHTPVDEFGNYDFETLEAIDITFFNQQLLDLIEGKAVEISKFSFQTGARYFDGQIVQLDKNEVLIIEGIHGLSPKLLPLIDPSLTFKLFISALTSISIDDHNPISSTDNRLIRRMIRDAKYRGYSALETIRRWPSVRRGEEKNIFPDQENADVMFNTALLYELAVLKKYAEPLLKSVPENQPEYAESLRLMKFLSYFKPIADTEIPPTSLIREFLGGSSFSYK
jgi:uridine kinase